MPDPPHDLLRAYRLRAVPIGVRLTYLVLGALVGYRLLPGRLAVDDGAYLTMLGLGAAGALVVSLLPWDALLDSPRGVWWLSAWSVLDIGLVTFAVAITGGADSPVVFLYVLTTIFFAASYPPRAQPPLLLFTVACYLWVVAVDAAPSSAAAVFMRVVSLSLVAGMVSFLSRELVRQMDAYDVARAESRSRAALLELVATAARSMSTLDPERVLGIVVDSVRDIGYDAAEITLYDEPAESWLVAHSRGAPMSVVKVQHIEAGVPGLVWTQRRTIVLPITESPARRATDVVDGDFTWVVASPVWSGGELAGVLVTGTTRSERPPMQEIECIDLLAAQAGAALHNARLFTERRAFEAKLAHQAFHDSLTDLPNRALFIDRLAHAVARLAREAEPLAVLFLDVDRFKTINDSLGHEVGDQLLVALAQRLHQCLRPGDTLARYGGDEFTVLLERLAAAGDAVEVAERIQRTLDAPFVLAGREIVVTASIGISYRDSEFDGGDPLREADVAMYRAKERGKARWEVFHSDMSVGATRRLDLELQLRHAVERGELELLYQPIVDLETSRIDAVEALVRWNHPTRGVILPGEFISLAEDNGEIMALGRWVLARACRDTELWRQDGLDVRVSVNLSARQFQRGDVVADVADALAASGLRASLLMLEITENVVMHDAPGAVAVMDDLRGLGVRLALDDFGQGYSSLGYLKRFPLDAVKIDKAFVDGVVNNPEDQAIVRSVVALAQALGIRVTAEGIESREQLHWCRVLGAGYGQGYLLSPPVPATRVSRLARAGALVR